jgi:hypothetical protein
MRNIVVRSALGALLLTLSACGGGKSPTSPSGSITFATDRTAGANAVFLRTGPGTTATHLQLEVVANQVTNVHDVNFVLGYPNAALSYGGQGQGPFLTQDANPAFLVATPLPSPIVGVVVIDARSNGAPGVSGTGVICRLELDVVAAGNGRITLNGGELRNAANQTTAGVDWIGGTVTVVR